MAVLKNQTGKIALGIMFAIAMFCAACEAEPEQAPQEKSAEFTIDEGDILHVYVWENIAPRSDKFTIREGDVLYINVWQEDDLSQDVIVRPDGQISFPLAGDVPAKGKTFTELKDELTLRLKEYVKYPIVSISLKKIEDEKVKEALNQEVMVRPDGRISLALAGDIMAKGLTFSQLKDDITNRLKGYIKLPTVSIAFKKIGGRKVIVLGEVNSPGVYTLSVNNTILEAIGMAEGFTPHAVPSSTIYITGGLKNPQGKRINLTKAIDQADMSQNIVLQPEDIIYVPKKFIANVNYALTQITTPILQGTTATTGIKSVDE